uniref:Uncharacterized protein n=1 Tax=Oryza punctata TaxID=4537 RepID=A0A0E0KDQ8_ORYPU
MEPHHEYLICNPTTRRRSLLPRLTPAPCRCYVALAVGLLPPLAVRRVPGAVPRLRFVNFRTTCSRPAPPNPGGSTPDATTTRSQFAIRSTSRGAPLRRRRRKATLAGQRRLSPPPETDVLLFELDGTLMLLELYETPSPETMTLFSRVWALEDYGGERGGSAGSRSMRHLPYVEASLVHDI